MTPSAQTEWRKECREFTLRIIKFASENVRMGRNYGWSEETIENELINFIQALLASERTRLLSVESMKMEEVREFKDGDLANNLLRQGEEVRNELRQSILSEMEKGK